MHGSLRFIAEDGDGLSAHCSSSIVFPVISAVLGQQLQFLNYRETFWTPSLVKLPGCWVGYFTRRGIS